MKPILFNAEMVRAILDGRKTVTRRVVKPQPNKEMPDNHNVCKMPIWTNDGKKTMWYMDTIEQYPFKRTRYFEQVAPYEPGDILYVRETWCDPSGTEYPFLYKADMPMHWDAEDTEIGVPIDLRAEDYTWRPSIHMPREAARLFLRVTDVRAERLKNMTAGQAMDEGFTDWNDAKRVWNSTIKKADLPRYGWDANPWVWVIEFERISKEEAQKGGKENG